MEGGEGEPKWIKVGNVHAPTPHNECNCYVLQACTNFLNKKNKNEKLRIKWIQVQTQFGNFFLLRKRNPLVVVDLPTQIPTGQTEQQWWGAWVHPGKVQEKKENVEEVLWAALKSGRLAGSTYLCPGGVDNTRVWPAPRAAVQAAGPA